MCRVKRQRESAMPRLTNQADDSKYNLDDVAEEIPDTRLQTIYTLRLWQKSRKPSTELIQIVGAILLDVGLKKTQARVLLVDRRQFRKFLSDYVEQHGSELSDQEQVHARNIGFLAEVL